MPESTQSKLGRIRPPRVHITYDVETGGAMEKRELPFVVGVMADLSCMPERPLPKLSERRFVEIDRDNFNDVMASIAPRVVATVDNVIIGDGSQLAVSLNFSSVADLDPVSIVRQIAPLRRLYLARQRLRDLLGKLDGNSELDGLLHEVAGDSESLGEIRQACASLPLAAAASSVGSVTEKIEKPPADGGGPLADVG